MHLHESSDMNLDLYASRRLNQRAGVRVAQSRNQPTGAFVAVEMAVLVIVTALAMVSIIVSTCGGDRIDRSGSGTRIHEQNEHVAFEATSNVAKHASSSANDEQKPSSTAATR
jgi:hypothetical protein